MKNTITISLLLCLALPCFAQPIEMPLKPMSYFNNDTVAYLRYNYPIKPFSEFQDCESPVNAYIRYNFGTTRQFIYRNKTIEYLLADLELEVTQINHTILSVWHSAIPKNPVPNNTIKEPIPPDIIICFDLYFIRERRRASPLHDECISIIFKNPPVEKSAPPLPYNTQGLLNSAFYRNQIIARIETNQYIPDHEAMQKRNPLMRPVR